MPTFKFSVHAGPTAVREITKRLQKKGIDAHAGTAHVYGTIEADDDFEARDLFDEAAGADLAASTDFEEMPGEEDVDLETEAESGYVISDSRRGGYDVAYEGRHMDHFSDYDDALVAILERMEKDQYWPNVLFVNERGNTDLLSLKPKMRKGKIVGASAEIVKSWV